MNLYERVQLQLEAEAMAAPSAVVFLLAATFVSVLSQATNKRERRVTEYKKLLFPNNLFQIMVHLKTTQAFTIGQRTVTLAIVSPAFSIGEQIQVLLQFRYFSYDPLDYQT